MSRRTAIAGGILLLWLGGLGLLVRREYFRPNLEQFAEAAMRITPGAVFYAVMQGDRQIGFASSTIDTAKTSVSSDDYLIADMPAGGSNHRTSVRTHVILSRALRVKSFTMSMDGDTGPVNAAGSVSGDTLLLFTIAAGKARPDTQHIRLTGPILLPTLVPLAIALGEKPKVGKSYVLPLFDPTTMTTRDVSFNVRAESLFVVNDSSVFDSTSGRWRGVLPDTLRGWQIGAPGAGGFAGWIDEQGRVLQTTQLGFVLRRLPYEVAFENWRMDVSSHGGVVDAKSDVLETTAVAANKTLAGDIRELRVVLGNVDLHGFDLAGGRQTLRGDTLTVRQEAQQLRASYTLPLGGTRLLPAFTRPEPLVQSESPEIKALALRITGGSRGPTWAAARITQWVHDSVRNEAAFGIPSALQVLHSRRGDCNEHTQLFLALARAAGLPARVAAGLAYVDGKFYYHAWPEVFLNGWVAVDPTFGQFPADAAHLRFTIGGLGRQTELVRLMGNLRIQVVSELSGRGTRDAHGRDPRASRDASPVPRPASRP